MIFFGGPERLRDFFLAQDVACFFCHAVAMQLLCSCYAVAMQLLCGCYAVALQLLWGFYAGVCS